MIWDAADHVPIMSPCTEDDLSGRDPLVSHWLNRPQSPRNECNLHRHLPMHRFLRTPALRFQLNGSYGNVSRPAIVNGEEISSPPTAAEF